MALKITDEQNYQDIADAIRNKLGSSDTFLPSEMADAIESIPTGGGTTEFKTKFIDYDGTVLYEYTQEEVEALTELPPLPSHQGLVCQEWNWNLADIKALGRQVIVGANYTTDNGRTKVYVSIPDYNRTILCEVGTAASGSVKIHWGDGTTYGPSSSINTSHTYEEPGDYVIEFEVLSGKLVLKGDMNYGTKICWSGNGLPTGTYGASIYITRIELGNNVSLDQFGLKKTGAKTISIPKDITTVGSTSYGQLSNNVWLKCIVLPKGMTQISAQLAYSNVALEYASIPNGVTDIFVLAFNECNSLKSFTYPDSISTIGDKSFTNCNHIENISFPTSEISFGSESFSGATGFNDPEFLSSIHNVPEKCFYNIDIKKIVLDDNTLILGKNALGNLTKVETFIMRKVPNQMNINSIGNLKAAKRIELPDSLPFLFERMFYGNTVIESFECPSGVRTINSDCFNGCSSLRHITFPPLLETIGTEVFYGCTLLTELIIPEGVSAIENYLCNSMKNLRVFICLGDIESLGKNNIFASCSRISLYDFSHCTQVPTLTSASSLTVNSDTEIKVPAELLEEFKAASGWSTYASNIVSA